MRHETSKLLDQFKHRSVRDLAWVIVSPPLVSGNLDDVHWWSYEDCLAEYDDCLIALKILDKDPQPLITHLASLKNNRLGSIFEGFMSYWLKISPNYQELYQNIQLIEDKHTYGEIDFIIQEITTGKVIHLEVAVKFYLGSAPYEDAYRWFGTNTKDQLGKKIDHLRTKQTQLSKNYPEQIKKYCSQAIDAKQCFIKGRLFYPEDSNTAPQNLSLTDNHLRGRWCYINEKAKSDKLIKINKSHWLADLNAFDINHLGASSQGSIDDIDRAECFVKCKENTLGDSEEQRYFYLPNTFAFPKN